MHKTVKSILFASLLGLSGFIQAQDINITLLRLNLSQSINNDIDSGLQKLSKLPNKNKDNLMVMFEEMNQTLKNAFDADRKSANELYNYMKTLENVIPINTSVAKLQSNNYSSHQAEYMHNALYLVLMGKSIKYYLLKKHGIDLAEHATYIGALSALTQVGDLSITQRFYNLASMLSIFHIEFEWLPEMLEQM